MNNDITPEILAEKVIISGIHVELTEALKNAALNQASRLLRHNEHIVRIRIDIEHDKTRSNGDEYGAKGLIEISGPDLIASATSEDAYKSIDLLADKLGRLVRRRHRKRVGTRNDLRNLAPMLQDGEVNVAFQDMQSRALGDQRDSDQEQKMKMRSRPDTPGSIKRIVAW
jgi:putative sigma-54 modulation protein